MNLEINKIKDIGTIDTERIVFKALSGGELGFYGVFKTKKIGETTVSSVISDTYWFPDKQVKQGDLVVLYSKVGFNNERKNADGTTSYFFYWGKTTPMWSTPNDAVVMFTIGEWKYKFVS